MYQPPVWIWSHCHLVSVWPTTIGACMRCYQVNQSYVKHLVILAKFEMLLKNCHFCRMFSVSQAKCSFVTKYFSSNYSLDLRKKRSHE